MRRVVGQGRAVQGCRPLAGLPLDRQQSIPLRRAVGQAAIERELVRRERDQLVEGAGLKFPRSACA